MITSWIDGCLFGDSTTTAHLAKFGSEAAANMCTITNCSIPTEADLTKIVGTGNSTIGCSGMSVGAATTMIGNADLAS
ncbi:unnamed protein product [marine sediment metagenome]|uniref:Uncharacterized protein n=1 Tax=marine sediment metagenome TaxID=412755 RepID=X1NAC9_9ZZZZ